MCDLVCPPPELHQLHPLGRVPDADEGPLGAGRGHLQPIRGEHCSPPIRGEHSSPPIPAHHAAALVGGEAHQLVPVRVDDDRGAGDALLRAEQVHHLHQ